MSREHVFTHVDPIIEAAVHSFGRLGFGAPLRGIAADAGVSAALIIKRYGSKDALHAACDAHVREWIRVVKSQNIDAAARGQLLSAIVDSDELLPMFAYIMQSLLAGGDVGRQFVDGMIVDAEQYMHDAVEKGLVKPSRDEHARARYLVTSALGSLLLTTLLDGQTADLGAAFRQMQRETAAPMIELYTEGVFTRGDVLDDYLRYLDDPPD
ncbi:TetR/AcrR family transcriptional regulator [Gordonia hydrophobica]|uniref:TetR family transcriptional regulator n=1 Tax=Gordonia hydrophobica TaxID=40516 RepID=A0ABZ2U629_9ACTN|nr:TetR family transcriptional regulator [Gordonia hydrophobica]MBM7365709.1 AcrR family transcriptional regulator [Gordonia hydrophobica]